MRLVGPARLGYGVNTVSFYGELDNMEYLLEVVEDRLHRAGLQVEFIDVEQHPVEQMSENLTEARLRFTLLVDGKEF